MLPPETPGDSMKNFAITLFAVLIGALIALFAYDRLVLAPRAAELAAQSAKTEKVDLDAARNEARAIAADLDASVKRSVDGAQQAMAAQATEADRRRLAADAMARTAMFRVALTEYYQTMAEWPADAKQAGLDAPSAYAGGAVTGIAIGAKGAVVATLNDTFSPPSRIRLTPHATPGGMVDWRCVVEGSDELRRYLLACKG